MFRDLPKKYWRQSNQAGPPWSFVGFTAELCISAVSTLSKMLRFCSKPFVFSCVAPVGFALRIPSCIGAAVPLYSGSLFGP
jgi:hypothetical protein